MANLKIKRVRDKIVTDEGIQITPARAKTIARNVIYALICSGMEQGYDASEIKYDSIAGDGVTLRDLITLGGLS